MKVNTNIIMLLEKVCFIPRLPTKNKIDKIVAKSQTGEPTFSSLNLVAI